MSKQPFIFSVQNGVLHPATPYDQERLQRFKEGQTVKVDRLVKPRSLPMHGKYWACLSQIVAATECAPTADHLHNLIKFKTGYTTPVQLATGEIVWIPDSTAFDKMSDGEYLEYIQRADRWCLENLGCPLMTEREAA